MIVKPAYPTLITALTANIAPGASLLRNLLLVIGGSLILWISAKIQVPFYPVPMTLQTLALFILVMAYGLRLGVASVALYLMEGAFGLPVFAGTPEKGIGIAYMFGGTGGYLLGFLLAAVACGWLAQRGWDRSIPKATITVFIGSILVFLPGVLWLGVIFGWDKPILAWGLTPFIWGALTKMAIAVFAMQLLWKVKKSS